MSRFYCWGANETRTYTVEAGNAREAAIKVAPLIIENSVEYPKDSILIVVMNTKDEIENWYVSIQRKFALDEE